MLNDDYYAICLDDPAVPPFCSFPKQYIGCEEALLTLADNLDRDGVYPKTAAGIRSYFAGNTGVTHVIALAEIPVIRPVEVLDISELHLGAHQWTHMNTFDCPYEMRFDSADVSQILVRHEDKILRCIRARFSGLAYLAFAGRWLSIGGTIFGQSLFLFGNFTCLSVEKNASETASSICARTAPSPLPSCGQN